MREEATYRDGVRAGLPLVLPTVALGASFGVLAEPVLGSVAAVPERVRGVVSLGAPALVAALVVDEPITPEGGVGVDARLVGLGAAVLALWGRLPVLGVVVAAAATALTRWLW